MKGTIKIRKGSDKMEPMVVYVKGWNSRFEYWITFKLNTSEMVMSREENLIDFNYTEFQKMYYQWQIDQLPRKKENLENLLNEIG